MNKNPLVSILTNSRNGAIFLDDLFETIDGQTYTNWEHIIFDNNSDDNTQEIVEARSNKTKYIKSKNSLSLPQARNAALKYCSGKYIAILDCDDLWDSQKLHLQINQLEKFSHSPFCTTNYATMINDKIIKNKFSKTKKNDFRSLLNNYSVSHSSVVFRKKSLHELNCIYDEDIKIANDKDLLLRLLINREYSNVNEILTFWRSSSEGTMYESLNLLAKDNKRILLKLENLIQNFNKRYKEEIYQNKMKINFHEAIYNWRLGKSSISRQLLKPFKMHRKILIFYYLTFFSNTLFPILLKIYTKYRNLF